MDAVLPEDVLHLICDELHFRQDLSTLFNLAVTSKSLAPIALTSLYRAGNQSPTGDDVSADVIAKWSVYWRSLTLASLGETLYPYNAYLRFLDLRDLGYLLLENEFRPDGQLERVFFAGPLAQFRHMTSVSNFRPLQKFGRRRLFDRAKIVDTIGAVIAANAPMVEVVSGKISPKVLQEWIPKLPRLQRLELEEGNPLGEEAVRNAIYVNCPNFCELSLFAWPDPDSDPKLASFISGLPEQSLKAFNAFSRCGISTETCLAFNNHGDSLTILEINNMEPAEVPALALLGGCRALEVFKLEASERVAIADSHKEVLEDFAAWLAGCEQLREIQLLKFNNAAAAITPLVLNDNTRLESITVSAFSQSAQYKSYHGEEARIFHQALLTQARTLQHLDIRGQIHDGEEPTVEDADVFINNLRQLTNLISLNLVGIMDESFGDDAIVRLVTPLKHLEDVSFGGYAITDEVLLALSTLRDLKRIVVSAASRFTLDGFLEFVSKLGPGNKDLVLSVENADFDYQLTEEEISLVSSALTSKVNGTFDIQAGRDPNAMMGEDSDSDYGG